VSAKLPKPVGPGARVHVVAPAGPVEADGLYAGIEMLGVRGFDVRPAPNLRERCGYFAGSDDARLEGVQIAIDDPEAHVLWAARGGYGTTRILDRLRLDRFAREPLWVVGCSDATALLLELWLRHRVVSIHGPMAARLADTAGEDVEELFALLGGGAPKARTDLEPLVPGTARGPLLGGNLFVLAHLLGAARADFAAGAVLFLEEVGERPYRIDRCLTQLKRAGVLSRVAGVVVGELTACDPGADGVTAMDAVREHLGSLGVPVAAGYPAAHGARNAPFLHGAEVELEVSPRGARLASLDDGLGFSAGGRRPG
jgi:muramoyltetrapeptide carboxypeptidase